MKTPVALLVSLLLPLASACVIEQSSPPPYRSPPPPPPGQSGPPPAYPGNPQPPPPAYPGNPPPPPPQSTPANVVGAWGSPACGARTYPRKIQFNNGGTFEAQDLVSPCPPKTACIWSGIVINKGTYVVEGGTIKLAVSQPGGPQAKPLPMAMAVDAATAAPVEMSPDGQRCAYGRE
jgi:hypothetical protein